MTHGVIEVLRAARPDAKELDLVYNFSADQIERLRSMLAAASRPIFDSKSSHQSQSS